MFMFIFYAKFLHYCSVAGKQPGISHHTPNKVRPLAAMPSLDVVCAEVFSAARSSVSAPSFMERIAAALNPFDEQAGLSLTVQSACIARAHWSIPFVYLGVADCGATHADVRHITQCVHAGPGEPTPVEQNDALRGRSHDAVACVPSSEHAARDTRIHTQGCPNVHRGVRHVSCCNAHLLNPG